MLPEGRCPGCGSFFCGWALKLPSHQMCPTCGAGLEITEDGRHFSKGYSPFTAEKYKINQSDWAGLEQDILQNRGNPAEDD